MLAALPAILLTLGLWWYGPVPQNEAYHQFADRRTHTVGRMRIPNFNDVMSNLQFVLVALFLSYYRSYDPASAYGVLLRAILLVGPCSAYYHFNPTSERLVVDRLAMSAAFGSLTAHAHGFPPYLLWPTVGLSMGSVAYWAQTNDLRPYFVVQYGGALSLLFTDTRLCVCVYAVAKLLERFDGRVYTLTGRRLSGHTMKHIVAALAAVFV